MANHHPLGHRRIMSGKLPGNIRPQEFTKGIMEKYPNLERINEHSNDIDNEEDLSHNISQMSNTREIQSSKLESNIETNQT